MPRVALVDGAYAGRSVLSGAQRSLNLYLEQNPPDAPFPYVLLPTPGLDLLAVPPLAGACRMLHVCSNGDLYATVGQNLYYVSPTWQWTAVGGVSNAQSQCYMTDNGTSAVVVDGSPAGLQVDLATRTGTPIADVAWYGATSCDTLDTYLLFSKPGTPQFYSTTSNAVTPFDPLYFANKSSYPDALQRLVVVHLNIWLIGKYSTEIWYDAGTPDFPFGRLEGAFIDQGTCAPASVAVLNGTVLFLSQTDKGKTVVLQGSNYTANRVSNHALENALAGYGTVADAIGMTFQLQGHPFYRLTFPSADATWEYDLATQRWHQVCWLDSMGVEHRHRANCCAFAYDRIVCGDWETGWLYELDPAVGNDYGGPIKRLASFPTLQMEGKRQVFHQLLLEMECGRGGSAITQAQNVSLSWSDDRGVSFGNPRQQPVGTVGTYGASVQFRRLGQSRWRVFLVEFSFDAFTAISGAYVDVEPCVT